jgi:exopolyphosphatase/guanosine-5'-triphosphate,3'-diphosphate pyrophosphatase
MRVAALDLGSNTCLCLIAEVKSNGEISVLSDLAEVVRLGQGVSIDKRLHPEALKRAEACLSRYADEIRKYRPDRILAAATAAARNATNSEELIHIGNKHGIPIEIISGTREAELTFSGAISARPTNSETLIIDIGGGSTELIIGTKAGIRFKKSFEVGVVRLKEKFVEDFPLSNKVRTQLETEIQTVLREASNLSLGNNVEVLAVAGTPTTLAAAVLGGYNAKKVDGFQFTLAQLLEWQNKLSQLTPLQVEQQFGVPPGRSDVLAVGVMILTGVLELVKATRLTVSVRGLRYGLASALVAQ